MAAQVSDLARPIDRRRRLAAAGFDAAGGVAAAVVAVAVAMLWLLLRSGLGRDDAGDGDAVLAFSLVAAVTPAWTVYVAATIWRSGSTPGQRRMGMAVGAGGPSGPSAPFDELRVSGGAGGPGGTLDAPRWRRGLRLTLHPLSLPAWVWLALTALLTGVPWLWLPLALAAAAVALAAVGSLTLLLVRPSLPAVHDWLARTSLTGQAERS